MSPRDAAAETTLMVLKQLGIEKSDWRKLLDVPGDKLLQVQVDLGPVNTTRMGGDGSRFFPSSRSEERRILGVC